MLAAACLATALYFEARGESTRGLEAVAEALLNRGGDVCAVVEHACKPYWHLTTKLDVIGATKAHDVVERVMAGYRSDFTKGATFFSRGLPSWAARPIRIGGHWFYHEKKPTLKGRSTRLTLKENAPTKG